MTFRPTHYAKPVGVIAKVITSIEDVTKTDEGCEQGSPDLKLFFADGTAFDADSSMTARFVPCVGDYVVWQSDGYVYLNPREVFERKYQPEGQAVNFGNTEDVAEFLHAVRHNARNRGDVDMAVVVYGSFGGNVYVETTVGSLETVGLLRLGDQIMLNTILPKGNIEE